MLTEYFVIYLYFFVSLLLSCVIILFSMGLVLRNDEIEKISAYECGFHPFQDTRINFDVKFYLVAILFIIFDLEIIFLFPWSLLLKKIGFFSYLTMIIFVLILLIGFYYEWKKGGLDWE